MRISHPGPKSERFEAAVVEEQGWLLRMHLAVAQSVEGRTQGLVGEEIVVEQTN
jgi:hypothetical protein